MYCMKCGKEISDGGEYCSVCGTRVGQSGKLMWPSGMSDSISERVKGIGECWIAFLIAIIAPIVCVLCLNETMFKVSVNVLGYGGTFNFSLLEEKEFLRKILFAGYIASIVMLVLPVLKKENWTSKNYKLSLVVPIVAIIMLFVGMTIAKVQVKEKYGDWLKMIDMEIKLAENAWYYIIANIAMFASAYSIRRKNEPNDDYEVEFDDDYENEFSSKYKVVTHNQGNHNTVGWRCSCGRENAPYVTSCVCGESRYKNQN